MAARGKKPPVSVVHFSFWCWCVTSLVTINWLKLTLPIIFVRNKYAQVIIEYVVISFFSFLFFELKFSANSIGII